MEWKTLNHFTAVCDFMALTCKSSLTKESGYCSKVSSQEALSMIPPPSSLPHFINGWLSIGGHWRVRVYTLLEILCIPWSHSSTLLTTVQPTVLRRIITTSFIRLCALQSSVALEKLISDSEYSGGLYNILCKWIVALLMLAFVCIITYWRTLSKISWTLLIRKFLMRIAGDSLQFIRHSWGCTWWWLRCMWCWWTSKHIWVQFCKYWEDLTWLGSGWTGFDPSWSTFLRYCNVSKIH
jgi:hypothetical protein